MRPYTREEDQYIRDNYATKGPRTCAKHLSRPYQSITHRRTRLGLPSIPRGEARNRMISAGCAHTDISNETPINISDFIAVKTPEIAYLLGLLWADGYVHHKKVVLTCVRDDALEYMPVFLKTGTWRFSDYHLERYGVKMRPSRTIRAGNVLLARYLISQGYAAKSNENACKILSTIPVKLHPYWFRGFMDGDGYISYSKRGIFWIRITSSFEQDWKHMESLCERLGIIFRIDRDRYTNRHGKINSRSVFHMNSAAGVKRFCDYIYDTHAQDHMGLTRKHDKWIEMEAFMKTRPKVGRLFD